MTPILNKIEFSLILLRLILYTETTKKILIETVLMHSYREAKAMPISFWIVVLCLPGKKYEIWSKSILNFFDWTSTSLNISFRSRIEKSEFDAIFLILFRSNSLSPLKFIWERVSVKTSSNVLSTCWSWVQKSPMSLALSQQSFFRMLNNSKQGIILRTFQ